MAGTIVADTLTHSTAGSIATNYVVNGSAKAWLQYNQATPVVNDSFNISSVTDNQLGQFTPNFTNNMNNDDYAISSTSTGNARRNNTFSSIATGSFQIYVFQIYSNDTYQDTTSGSSVHGDLA